MFPREVKEGQPIQVPCTVTEGDEPISIVWYKDTIVLASTDITTISKIGSKMSLLIIEGVGYEHSGRYACAASNAAGSARVEADLRVQGRMKHTSGCRVG